MDVIIHLSNELKKDLERLEAKMLLMTKLLGLLVGAAAASLPEDEMLSITKAAREFFEND